MATRAEATLALTLTAKDKASPVIKGAGKTTRGLADAAKVAAVGIGLVVGGLAFAVKAAADEQKGIAKLDAALKANVKGWNGNRDAIEKVIAKREDLAFSDDSLRASMATLVTSTGDVTEAQRLQAIAMDLARAKGIDLETASIAVAKASQGSTKELKALGLEIDDTATASENLARIQEATAGQAEAYAGTMLGKWETFGNKLGNVVETIGEMLLPIVEQLMDFLLTTGIPALQDVAAEVGPIVSDLVNMGKAIYDWAQPAFQALIPFLQAAAGGLTTIIELVSEYLGILNTKNKTVTGGFKADAAARTAAAFAGSENLTAPVTATGGASGTGALLGMAHGGTATPGWSWVGEQGPELVRFSGGQRVYPAGQSAAMAQGGGTPVEIPVILDGNEVGRVIDRRLFYRTAGA